MTAATIDEKYDSVPLAQEHLLVDVNEAYTVVSKLSKPLFCQITVREDVDAYVSYELSGKTITFHESSGSGVKLAVTIYGKL